MTIKTLGVLIGLSVTLCGCSILAPKRVELFQDKVAKFPEPKQAEKEAQRQAALRAEEKARETLQAALGTDADQTVVAPATETVVLTDALAKSVGPPLHAPGTNVLSTKLASDLLSAVAKLNVRVDNFKADSNENAGKKIEGTGVFSMGYFSMWLGIAALGALVWFGIKVYGMVNPAVGLGANVVGRVSTAVLKKGFTEIAEGGEWFKEYLKESNVAEDAKKLVLELFSRAHVEAQSRDTQSLISQLTAK